jgi:hypothetical protein
VAFLLAAGAVVVAVADHRAARSRGRHEAANQDAADEDAR